MKYFKVGCGILNGIVDSIFDFIIPIIFIILYPGWFLISGLFMEENKTIIELIFGKDSVLIEIGGIVAIAIISYFVFIPILTYRKIKKLGFNDPWLKDMFMEDFDNIVHEKYARFYTSESDTEVKTVYLSSYLEKAYKLFYPVFLDEGKISTTRQGKRDIYYMLDYTFYDVHRNFENDFKFAVLNIYINEKYIYLTKEDLNLLWDYLKYDLWKAVAMKLLLMLKEEQKQGIVRNTSGIPQIPKDSVVNRND